MQIPGGIEHGTRLRFPGKGEPSRDGRAAPGDLYMQILVEQHKHFRRQGGDIICALELTPAEANAGSKKRNKRHPGEKIEVSVPEMSQEGTQIMLQGKGIPYPAGTGRLVVLCHIHYPKKMSKKAKEMLKNLREEGW